MNATENKATGVAVYRMESYGHRRFGDSRMFERDEVRLVGNAYVAVLRTWRQDKQGEPRAVFEYALPTEYQTVPEAVGALVKQRVEYLRAQAEDRTEAVKCARAALIESGMG